MNKPFTQVNLDGIYRVISELVLMAKGNFSSAFCLVRTALEKNHAHWLKRHKKFPSKIIARWKFKKWIAWNSHVWLWARPKLILLLHAWKTTKFVIVTSCFLWQYFEKSNCFSSEKIKSTWAVFVLSLVLLVKLVSIVSLVLSSSKTNKQVSWLWYQSRPKPIYRKEFQDCFFVQPLNWKTVKALLHILRFLSKFFCTVRCWKNCGYQK